MISERSLVPRGGRALSRRERPTRGSELSSSCAIIKDMARKAPPPQVSRAEVPLSCGVASEQCRFDLPKETGRLRKKGCADKGLAGQMRRSVPALDRKSTRLNSSH